MYIYIRITYRFFSTYIRTGIILSIAANFSYGIYYSIVNFTYLTSSAGTLFFASHWTFENIHMARAIFYGIISAALCLATVISMGICRKIFTRIRDLADASGYIPGDIVPAAIGGVIIGNSYDIII